MGNATPTGMGEVREFDAKTVVYARATPILNCSSSCRLGQFCSSLSDNNIFNRLPYSNQPKFASLQPRRTQLVLIICLEKHKHNQKLNNNKREHTAMKINELLRWRRRNRGLSQDKVAHWAGVTQARLSKFESGRLDVRLSTALNIASALDMQLVAVAKEDITKVNKLLDEQQIHVHPAADLQELSSLGDE